MKISIKTIFGVIAFCAVVAIILGQVLHFDANNLINTIINAVATAGTWIINSFIKIIQFLF